MIKLKDISSFIQRQDIKSDPFWQSMLHSNSRNLFPKYELAKIELTKNKVSKQRLIMEELGMFLSLELYAKKDWRL